MRPGIVVLYFFSEMQHIQSYPRLPLLLLSLLLSLVVGLLWSLLLLSYNANVALTLFSIATSNEAVIEKPPPPLLADIPSYLLPNMPAQNKSIFFTGHGLKGTHEIKAWAATVGLTSIGVVWKTGNDFLDPDNYNGTPAMIMQFAIDFSSVYANETSGTAYLIIEKDNQPKADGIFYRNELQIMIMGGKVDKIIRLDLNPDFTGPMDLNSTNIYWKKGDPKPPAKETP